MYTIGRSKSRGSGKDKLCRYCKKEGHLIDDYWKLENKEKRNGTWKPKNKSDADGKVNVTSGNKYDSDDVLVVFPGCVSCHDEWILDFTCSFHICCNRDWFSTHEFVKSGDVVRMRDDNPHDIVGIGSVQIRPHDSMIRTLTDVRHIPGMARNLISLSTRDVKGYQHSGYEE